MDFNITVNNYLNTKHDHGMRPPSDKPTFVPWSTTSIDLERHAEEKPKVDPQEEFVTDWQAPTDGPVSFQAPVKEKGSSKPQAEIVTDWQMPTETKTPEKPAETASRVPTTIKMDDPEQLADFINWGIRLNEFGIQTPEKLDASGPIDVMGMDTVKMADSSTAFFKIGMNTINSIARDGIFTVDGEQLAKPGA